METIGDAYMAVGNLMEPQKDHGVRVARFAMDAVNAASETLSAFPDKLRCRRCSCVAQMHLSESSLNGFDSQS